MMASMDKDVKVTVNVKTMQNVTTLQEPVLVLLTTLGSTARLVSDELYS